MRAVNVITLVLLIVGGLNWGLVGLADVDLAELLGADRGAGSQNAQQASSSIRDMRQAKGKWAPGGATTHQERAHEKTRLQQRRVTAMCLYSLRGAAM